MAPMSQLTYCKPQEAGLASEARAVGRRVAELLDALSSFSWSIVDEGGMDANTLPNDCRMVKMSIIEKMRDEGWRIRVKENGKYSVLPPKDY